MLLTTALLAALGVAYLLFRKKRDETLRIAVETQKGITITGEKLMATITLLEKVKLTGVPNGAIKPGTEQVFTDDATVTLEAVEGEFAVYAKAASLGTSIVIFRAESIDGLLLASNIPVQVVTAPATFIDIVAGTPEPL